MNGAVNIELEQLCQIHNGVLHPEHVVAYARDNPSSALYGRFEWDDTKAAHAHRLQTARNLIGVHIRVIDDGQERKPYRAFFSPIADSHGPSGYVSTEAKLSHPDGRREISLQVLARMRSIYESYPLDELAPVIDAIDECRARLIRTEVPA